MTRDRARMFLLHWTLWPCSPCVVAFIVHLAMRGRTVSLGYELGNARQEQSRLRDVKRVHELEAASYKTPERDETVARSPPRDGAAFRQDRIAFRSTRRSPRREESRPRAARNGSRVRMGTAFAARWRLGLGGFVNSAYRVQVEDHKQWEETAENQRQQRLHIEPKRGGIYDRNGAALAAEHRRAEHQRRCRPEMLRGIEGQNAQERSA